MRQHHWLWVLVGVLIAITGAWWYVGRVNTSHPAKWANPGGDAGRRHFAKEPLPTAPTLLWSYELTPGEIPPTARMLALPPPVVWADGTVYAGMQSKVHAVGPDGKRKWAWEGKTPISNLALGRQGTLYAQADGMLYALNPDGTMEWQVEIPVQNNETRGMVVGQGGVIYVCGREYLVAVSSSGDRKWRFKGENITAGPVEMEDGKVAVLIGSQLYLLDRDGNSLWNRNAVLPVSVLGLAASKDRIYVNGTGAHMVFDQTGMVVTNTSASVPISLVAIGPDFVHDGLTRFDRNWQQPDWRADTQPGLQSTVSIADGSGNVIIVSAFNPQRGTAVTPLRMLDAKGVQKWEFTEAQIYGVAMAAAGKGRVCVIGLMEGSVRLICIGDR